MDPLVGVCKGKNSPCEKMMIEKITKLYFGIEFEKFLAIPFI
jgi:hypothetical protein